MSTDTPCSDCGTPMVPWTAPNGHRRMNCPACGLSRPVKEVTPDV